VRKTNQLALPHEKVKSHVHVFRVRMCEGHSAGNAAHMYKVNRQLVAANFLQQVEIAWLIKHAGVTNPAKASGQIMRFKWSQEQLTFEATPPQRGRETGGRTFSCEYRNIKVQPDNKASFFGFSCSIRLAENQENL